MTNITKHARFPLLLAFASALGGFPLLAQGKCVDTPLVFSISFVHQDGKTPTTLYSDGVNGSNPSYVDGVDGVQALLRMCGTTILHDATLNVLSSATRKMGFDLRNIVASNSLTPSWTATPLMTGGFLNIRNILYNYNPNASYSFTTRLGTQFPTQVKTTDKNPYHVRMLNPLSDAVGPESGDATANYPYTTALVTVVHTPATPTTPETWTAYSLPTHIGTLLKDQNNGAPLNAGQLGFPFTVTITRK